MARDSSEFGERMKKAMADFILDGDRVKFEAEMHKVSHDLTESLDEQLTRELDERRQQPPKPFEEIKKEVEEVLLMDVVEAVVCLREEVEKYSQDIIECFIEPQEHNWMNANPCES